MAIEEPFPGISPTGPETFGLEDMLRGLVRHDLGISQDIPNNLRNLVRRDLREQGYEIIGELPTREELTRKKELEEAGKKYRAAEAQKGVKDFIKEPGFWQQMRDLGLSMYAESVGLMPAQATSIASEAVVSGLTLRNQEFILNTVGKIAGQPEFYKTFKEWQKKGLKKKLGYVPSPEVTAFVEAPLELAAVFVPISGIFKAAAIPARIATKVPFLQALARAQMTGLATGLLRKPEEEGFWNRLKQVPGDVAFFALFETGLLGATQGYKMYRWAKQFKGKPPKWAGTFGEYVPPPVGAAQREILMSKPEFKELLRKITTRPSQQPFEEFLTGLSRKERDVFEALHGKEQWSDVWNRVKQEGIFREVIEIPGYQPPGIPTFEAQRIPLPRRPRFADIFRQVDKYGRPLGAPEFEPFAEEVPPRPGVEPEVPPAEAPPPREAPPEVAPPPREAPPEAVPAPEVAPARAPPPAVMVDVTPTAEGGWTIKIPQPVPTAVPGGLQPGPTIPWRPVVPEALPPYKKPPKVIKPRKKPVFKNPFYEAVNQLGGVAPNPDYPYASLKEIFPPGLIKKAGMPMDTLAQAMRHEFPTIESDADLWDMADEIRRGRATFRDEVTGDEHVPPREEVEAEYQRFLDREPAEMTKADFNSQIKVAIKNTKTGEVHKGRPEEIIHADMFTRIQNKGIKPEDMEAGFIIPSTNQFIFSYSLRRPKPGQEPTPGPKYDRETFHRELVRKALDKGEYIPDEILAQHKRDYPELFREPVVFKTGDAVEFDTPAGVKTGEITAVNKKEGIATIRTEDGAIASRNLEDLRIREKPPEVVPEKPPRVAEAKPPPVPEKLSLTEIEKTLDEMAIPRIKRGVLADQIIRNYKPEKGPLKAYIKSILPKITEEGELRVKPTIKRAVKPARITPEMEEVIPGRAERPEDIFERAEEEARVQKIFKESTKTERERDILDRKILKGQSYDDIGRAHGITRQRAEQIFKESFEKVKDHPDVKAMIERKMRQANLGPIPSEQDLKDLGKFIRKYFWSTKGVDKVVDAVNDKRIGHRLAEIFGATHEAKVIKNFLKKNRNEALDALILDALKGEVPISGSALPDEVKDALRMMRDRIDKLSELIMAHGGLTEQTKATFEANLGRYIGKFYRLHQQRRWDPPKEVKDRFKAMLRRNYPDRFGDFTEEELDNFTEGILNEERKFGFGTRRAKRIPTGHFKKRIRLSREWKELAGEIHDPVWLYLKTISDSSTMAYNAEFLNKIKQTYPDLWVTTTAEAEKKGWQKYRLPANYGYGELKNKYVYPELYNYIVQEVDPAVSGVERAIMRYITNPFKWTKTIGSVPTHARNFQGNYMFSILMRNSIFNPFNIPYYKDSIKTFMLRNTTMKKEWGDLVKLGVTETQFWGAEIPKFYEEMLKLDPVKWPERLYNHTLKAGIARAGNAYNFEDALYRIASHYKNIRHFKMAPEESVKEINLGMTNYRKLPVVVEVLRRYPVMGPFISFRWNVGKIVVNQAVQATKEMAKKGTRAKGSLRLARLLFVLGIPTMLAKVSKEIFDVDDEQTKKLETFYPKYRQNGVFAYFRGKEGQLKALDLTYIWPTGDIERGIKSLVRGDVDTFKDAIDLFAHPVFDAWSILIEGRQPYWGTKIQGGFFKRIAEIAKLLWLPASAPIPSAKSLTESLRAGKFEPRAGALTGYQMKALIDAWNQEPDKYGRVRILSEEIKGFFTGLRTWNVEPDKVLLQSHRAIKSEAMQLRGDYFNWLANNKMAPEWEIKDRREKMMKEYDKLLEKANEIMTLYKELKEGGFLVQKEK